MSIVLPPGVDLSMIPAGINPDGSPPNFINPPNNAHLVQYVGGPLMAIAFLCVILRVWTNLRVVGKLLADDYLCVLALISGLVYFGLGATFGATARHTWDIPLSTFTPAVFKRLFAFNLMAGPTFALSKYCVIFLYMRLFKTKRWFRLSCYFICFLTLGYWDQVPLSAVYCAPSAGEPWGFDLATKCGKLAVNGPIQGALSTGIDLALILLPLPIIRDLQLSFRKKIALLFVFLIGVFALIASIISLYFRVQVYTSPDASWNGPMVTACAVAESAVTIICSCGPAMASFWVNTLVPSAFYSRITSLRSTFRTTTSGKEASNLSSKGGYYASTASVSRSNLVPGRDDYYELKNAAEGQSQVSQRNDQYLASPKLITKSTTIDQVSERSV